VYSGSRDGTLRLWDVVARACLRVFPVREAVCSLALHAALRQAVLCIDWREGHAARVITFDLDSGRPGSSAMKMRAPGPLAMNPHGNWPSRPQPPASLACGTWGAAAAGGCVAAGSLVASLDRHSLFVWRVGPEVRQPLNLHHTRPYTCLALSADDSVLAAGDDSGRILIWRDLAAALPEDKRAGLHSGKLRPKAPLPCTTLHWHAAAVGCLAFSPDAVFLRSGGQEAVMVQWQLEGSKPTFLPRLGGALLGLTHCPSDPALLLVRQANNTLRLVNTAAMKESGGSRGGKSSRQGGSCRGGGVEGSVVGVAPLPPQASAAQAARATTLHPRSGLLLLPTAHTQLQLYDCWRQRHVALVQVCSRNPVTSTGGQGAGGAEAGGAALEPWVSHALFCSGGAALVTVDLRQGAGPGPGEATLRFWDAVVSAAPGAGSPGWALNTRVDNPHRGPLSSLSCHPSSDLVVSTGGGQQGGLTRPGGGCTEFRVWERVPTARRPGSSLTAPSCWRCRSVGSYQGAVLGGSAWSPDGSLLALAAGHKVTLWEPLGCRLLRTLPGPTDCLGPGGAEARPMEQLAFTATAPYLVGSSGHWLVVWDLLAGSIAWALPLTACSLAADPAGDLFAVGLPPRVPQGALGSGGRQPEAATAPGQTQGGAKEGEGGSGPAGLEGEAALLEGGAGGAGTSDRPASGAVSSHVLVFSPRSPAPLLAARLPHLAHPTLLFTAPGMPQHAVLQHAGNRQGADSSSGGGGEAAPVALSRLLVLGEERSFSSSGPAAEEVGQQGLEQAQGQGSVWEAAFGAGSLGGGGGQALGLGAGQEGEAAPLQARQRQSLLFDTPSHVLPPPAALASAFLQLACTTHVVAQ
ncbi:hypothetical protein QJQ45_021053, partial [Haematococcus lacustris]